MANVMINDEHLIAIGDTLRSKLGETKIGYPVADFISGGTTGATPDNLGYGTSGQYNAKYWAHTFPGAASIKVKVWFSISGGGYIDLIKGAVDGYDNDYVELHTKSSPYEWTITGNSFTFGYGGRGSTLAWYFECYGYDADGNQLGYVGSELVEMPNTFKPRDMASAIDQLGKIDSVVLDGSTGGSMIRACSSPIAEALIQQFPAAVTTTKLRDISQMFNSYKGTTIPFDLNFDAGSDYYSVLTSAFSNAQNLETLPRMIGAYPSKMSSAFYNCTNLRDMGSLGEDCATWDFSYFNTGKFNDNIKIFTSCNSLRTVPTEFLKHLYDATTSYSYSVYYYLFNYCYNLDEVIGLGVSTGALTSNAFRYTFSGCYNLRRFTFDMNEDGTPKTASWQSQVIDLSAVGFFETTDSSAYYRDAYLCNSGRTRDKAIYDASTYAALKNDPDAYVFGTATEEAHKYSFYNKESAIETINSLPDCSAVGTTNTIKFKGAAGEYTDAGAINTMEQEYIDLAASKGWTVTFV
jgi:hypothetical protein